MPEDTEFCRACCYVVLADAGSKRIVGMASAVVSGGTLSIFHFNVRGDYWNLGLEAEFLSRLEAWGRGRGATEVRWRVQGPSEQVSARDCGYRLQGGIYVKSLEAAPVMVRGEGLPPAWQANGVCLLSRELERPPVASACEVLPFGEGSLEGGGPLLGTILPFGEGPLEDGGSPGFLRSEDVAAMERGEIRAAVYYAVTARTSTRRVGCVSGVVSADVLLIWNLEVRPAHRRLRRELLGRFEDLGRELGATEAWQRPATMELRQFVRKHGYSPTSLTGLICEKPLESLPKTVWKPRKGIVFEALRLFCFVPTWPYGTRLMAD